VQNATVEAEKLKEQARREADGLRNSAAREGDAIKSGGTAQIDQLRAKLREEVEAQVLKGQGRIRSPGRGSARQAESIRREADHEAQATRQNAYLDTENLRRTVEREAAEARSKLLRAGAGGVQLKFDA
jgi:hypothetical protein